MASKTKASNRVGFPLRMEAELRVRLTQAAVAEGTSANDLALYAIERFLDTRDAEIVADKRRADLERRLEAIFKEIAALLAGGKPRPDKTKADLHEEATAAIDAWRDHASSNHYAEPRTELECSCKAYCDIEAKIVCGPERRIDTFEDGDVAIEDEILDEPGDPE
jgi:hypothetical protein